MKNILHLGWVLFIVCFFAAGSLAFVYRGTKDTIMEQALAEKTEALKMVLPQADQFTEKEAGVHWEGSKAGNRVGDVLDIIAKGYGGPIEIVVGLDLEKRITGMRIISHTETPGLGAKIITDSYQKQYTGKQAAQLLLTKEDPLAGTIDAITAATISSRAVTNAVRTAIEALP